MDCGFATINDRSLCFFYAQIQAELNCEVGLVSILPGPVHQVISNSTGVGLLLHTFAVTLIIQATALLGCQVGLEVREPLPRRLIFRAEREGSLHNS
jgi:hypothetical protein